MANTANDAIIPQPTILPPRRSNRIASNSKPHAHASTIMPNTIRLSLDSITGTRASHDIKRAARTNQPKTLSGTLSKGRRIELLFCYRGNTLIIKALRHWLKLLKGLQTIVAIMNGAAQRWSKRRLHLRFMAAAKRTRGSGNYLQLNISIMHRRWRKTRLL